jgi:hypothetical protein
MAWGGFVGPLHKGRFLKRHLQETRIDADMAVVWITSGDET